VPLPDGSGGPDPARSGAHNDRSRPVRGRPPRYLRLWDGSSRPGPAYV